MPPFPTITHTEGVDPVALLAQLALADLVCACETTKAPMVAVPLSLLYTVAEHVRTHDLSDLAMAHVARFEEDFDDDLKPGTIIVFFDDLLVLLKLSIRASDAARLGIQVLG